MRKRERKSVCRYIKSDKKTALFLLYVAVVGAILCILHHFFRSIALSILSKWHKNALLLIPSGSHGTLLRYTLLLLYPLDQVHLPRRTRSPPPPPPTPSLQCRVVIIKCLFRFENKRKEKKMLDCRHPLSIFPISFFSSSHSQSFSRRVG